MEGIQDEGSIMDLHNKLMNCGIGCFKRLALLQLTALAQITRAKYMKQDIYFCFCIRLKFMHAGLSAETGSGHCTIYENSQEQKQGN